MGLPVHSPVSDERMSFLCVLLCFAELRQSGLIETSLVQSHILVRFSPRLSQTATVAMHAPNHPVA